MKFYSVINNRLAGMSRPTTETAMKELCKKHEIGLFVAVIEKDRCPPCNWYRSIKHIHIDWSDTGVVDKSIVDGILEEMHYTIEMQQKKVVVHCLDGMGRTGTLLACYMIRYKDMKAQQAIDHVRLSCMGAINSSRQELFIIGYEQSLVSTTTFFCCISIV